MTVDYNVEKAIREAAVELRKKHAALDWSAGVDTLIELEGLAQSRYSKFGPNWSLADFVRESKKKRPVAFMSVKEKVIILADDIPNAREAFAKGHELGHSVIPWHSDILYVCDEHDLSAATRAQMEWEASTFSAEVSLPGPLLDHVYSEFPTSMETVVTLRKRTRLSLEACAVAYAKRHPGRCVLLGLEEGIALDGQSQLKVVSKTVSALAAKSRLGKLDRGQIFGPKHALFRMSRSTSIAAFKTTLTNDVTKKEYSVSALNTTYKVLAFIFEE